MSMLGSVLINYQAHMDILSGAGCLEMAGQDLFLCGQPPQHVAPIESFSMPRSSLKSLDLDPQIYIEVSSTGLIACKVQPVMITAKYTNGWSQQHRKGFPKEDKTMELPIHSFWSKYQTDHTISSMDYFKEIQCLLEHRESLFTCPICASADELGVETNENSSEVEPTARCMKETEVSPNSPTYPWTSMAFPPPSLFRTTKEVSSQLGHCACLGKTQEQIKALLRDPKEKVTSASGNIFYMNSVSKAIAMVAASNSS
ncbi:hypothetical protein BKA82DRAFT_4020403 [Pisolithus tinctorius]|nr:hypothetical protein BKA82DRAFT_4020403 [Pisolithus tinctorius]